MLDKRLISLELSAQVARLAFTAADEATETKRRLFITQALFDRLFKPVPRVITRYVRKRAKRAAKDGNICISTHLVWNGPCLPHSASRASFEVAVSILDEALKIAP